MICLFPNYSKKKILFLGTKLLHYRIPIFNLLAQKFDITFTYSNKLTEEILNLCHFKTIYLETQNICGLIIHKDRILKICLDYDVVVANGNIKWLKYSKLAFLNNRHFKLIYWSIGVSSSDGFDKEKNLYYFLMNLVYSKADALIFYSDYPIKKRLNLSFFSFKKMFVANNTLDIPYHPYLVLEKDSILFIGSLNKRKGIMYLLENYEIAYKNDKNVLKLIIVGSGTELVSIQEWISQKSLMHKIQLYGSVFEENKKYEIFKKAVVCISPTQAGLAVLESMGYGVPFVTTINAITGGETFNIINRFNGLILDTVDEISDVILDASKNKGKFAQMGKMAYEYYWTCRKSSDMVDGLEKAINFVINK